MLQRIVNILGVLAKSLGVATIVFATLIATVGLVIAAMTASPEFAAAFSICLGVSILWLIVVLVPTLKHRILHSDAERVWLLVAMMITGVYLSFLACVVLAVFDASTLAVIIVATLTLIIPVSYLILDKLGLTGIFDGIHLPDFGDD
ncbi:hypothetical protein LOC67_22560 [Stieleria sp. JC731]|uniref:hypothetical protein n=1 Tax=Stieleria sp. JC731 TaxID=2894195 RepID=UPI001E5773D1|nr:hypothetical protein [Stieleria sp. JC731]MCC9603342.1 hypothetical protein [Stieleria sp. JC731]